MKSEKVALPATAVAVDPAEIEPVPVTMVAVTVAEEVVALSETSAIQISG